MRAASNHSNFAVREIHFYFHVQALSVGFLEGIDIVKTSNSTEEDLRLAVSQGKHCVPSHFLQAVGPDEASPCHTSRVG